MSDLTVNMDRCIKLVTLERRKKKLESELKETEKAIASLWKPILTDLFRCGLKNISLKTGEQLRPHRSVFCNKKGGVDSRLAAEKLKEAGISEAVHLDYKPSILKDWIRIKEAELIEEKELPPKDLNDLLPEILRPLFQVSEVHKIVVYGAR